MEASTPPLRCKCRKKQVTSLRCSRCFVPICPDCSKNAPVGMICKQCASAGRSPIYQVDAATLAKAAPLCLLTAIVGGFFLTASTGFSFFSVFLSFVYGFCVADIGYRMSGRKRGTGMEIMVGTCVALGLICAFAIHFSVPGIANFPYAGSIDRDGASLPTAMELAKSALMNPFNYLLIGTGIFGAICRIRRD